MADETFGIAVQLNPGDSVAKAKQVEDGLAKAEEASKRAARELRQGFAGAAQVFGPVIEAIKQHQAALERTTEKHRYLTSSLPAAAAAFGKLGEAIKQQSEALARTSQLHEQLTQRSSALHGSLGGLSQAIQQEADIIERIKGPAREYASELAALDRLLDRNTISTQEYTKEVTRLNQVLGETPPAPVESAQKPTFGGGVRALAGSPGLATKGLLVGGLLGAGHEVEQMVQESDDLEDRYTNLTNVALKFANNGKTVNSALNEQTALARELRAQIGPTMELYDGVSDAMRKYGLTTKEQIDLTGVLGKEMVINNKPVSDAAGLIQRLSVALETGQGAGRQFRTIMAEYPEIADAMAEGFHTDLNGLVELIEQGKARLPGLTQALVAHSDSILSEHAKRKKTYAEERAEFIETAEVAVNRGVPAMLAYAQGGAEAAKSLEQIRNPGREVREVVGNISAEVAEQVNKWKVLEAARESAIGEKFLMKLHSAADGVRALSDVIAIGFGRDAWAGLDDKTGFISLLPKGTKAAMDHAASIGALRKQYDELKAAQAAGGASALAVQKAHEELATALNGGELPAAIRLWHEINDPIRQYHQSTDALDSLLKSGAITLGQYVTKLREVKAAFGDLNETRAAVDEFVNKTQDRIDGAAEKAYRSSLAQQQKERDAAEQQNGKDFNESLKKYQDSQGDSILNANKAAIEAADQLQKKNEDAAKKSAEAWAQGAGQIAGNLISAAMKGEASVEDMVEQSIAALAKLALQQAAISMGGPGGAFLGSLVGALGGGANGFDYVANSNKLQMPGFAHGGDATVMGSGGTDSKIAMFRITPGESLHVRTPQQRMAEQSHSGGGGGITITPTIKVLQPPERRDIVDNSFDGLTTLVRLQRRVGRSRR